MRCFHIYNSLPNYFISFQDPDPAQVDPAQEESYVQVPNDLQTRQVPLERKVLKYICGFLIKKTREIIKS